MAASKRAPAPRGRRSAGVRGRTTPMCEAAARYGPAAAALPWQSSFARFIYSFQKLSKISLLPSADDIFFPLVSQAYLAQNICPPLLLLVCHIAIVLIAAER